jgi:hypothetical protein
VRDGTQVIARRAVLGANLTSGGDGTLLLSRAGARGVRSGSFVVVPATRFTPHGLLAQVRLIGSAGGRVRVRVVSVGLAQVFPELNLDVRLPRRVVSASLHRRARASGGPFSKNLSCSSSVVAMLSGKFSASIAPQLQVHLHLHFLHLPAFSAKLQGNIDESASLAASVTGAASCTLKSTPLGPAIPLGTFPVPIPGTPIVLDISPTLQFSANGSVTTNAAANASAGNTLHADAGIQYQNGHVSPFWHFHNVFNYQPPTFTGDTSLMGAVKAQLTMRIEGTKYGPDFSLTDDVAFTADSTANPCWTLDDDLAADAGIDLGKLAKVPDLTLYQHTFNLAHAPGPCGTPTVTVTNPGNQTGTVGTPVTLPVHAVDTDGGPLIYTATSLPAGLTINPKTGLITGTPTTPGTSTVVVTAKEPSGTTGFTTFTWTITAPPGRWTGTFSYSDSITGTTNNGEQDSEHGSVSYSINAPTSSGGREPFIPETSGAAFVHVDSFSYDSKQTFGCLQYDNLATSLDPANPAYIDVHVDNLRGDAGGPNGPTAPDSYTVTWPGVAFIGTFTQSGYMAGCTGFSQSTSPMGIGEVAVRSPNEALGSDPTHLTGTVSGTTNGSGTVVQTWQYSWDLQMTNSPDSDSDGLSDYLEKVKYGTDPTNPDTDGDGYSDGAEIAAGTDPLDPNSHP